MITSRASTDENCRQGYPETKSCRQNLWGGTIMLISGGQLPGNNMQTLQHSLSIYQVSSWLDENCSRSYPEMESFQQISRGV